MMVTVSGAEVQGEAGRCPWGPKQMRCLISWADALEALLGTGLHFQIYK